MMWNIFLFTMYTYEHRTCFMYVCGAVYQEEYDVFLRFFNLIYVCVHVSPLPSRIAGLDFYIFLFFFFFFVFGLSHPEHYLNKWDDGQDHLTYNPGITERAGYK